MTSFRNCALALLFNALLGSVTVAQTYDLRVDWSDTSNPNGVWAYRQGTSPLPAGTWSADFSTQPAWTGANGFVLPVWLRAQSTAGFDVQVGDIVTHSTDPGSGGSNGVSNVTWTSTAGGTINITGGVWMIRDIGRSDDWFLRLNGTLLSSGSLSSGDAFNRANPFDLNAGSGGSLNNISVNPGDVVELSLVRTSAAGDYIGVNLAVTLTASVPELSALAMGGVGLVATGLLAFRLRKRRRVRLPRQTRAAHSSRIATGDAAAR